MNDSRGTEGAARTLGRFKASEESLARSRRLAKSLGIPYDAKEVRRLSDDLHAIYFEELRHRIGWSDGAVQFEAGAFRILSAFTMPLPTSRRAAVGFDEQLDFFSLTVTHLMAVAACRVLKREEQKHLAGVFRAQLELKVDPYAHEEVRDDFQHFLEAYPEELKLLSHQLSKSMIAFVMLHELGHVALGHFGLPPTVEHELEADSWAANALIRLANNTRPGDYMSFVHRHLAAPGLLFRVLGVACRATGQNDGGGTHPSSQVRAAAVQELVAGELGEEGHQLEAGFESALWDIVDWMQLP